ncbi:MAG: hypothetical protein NVS9B10_13600 [Nevskia sp.]
MSGRSSEDLRRELGGRLPGGVEALADEQLAAFTESLRRAKRNQQQQIEAALEAALSHLPALLRGTVRKLFDA